MVESESEWKQYFRVDENLFLVDKNDRRVLVGHGEEELVRIIGSGSLDAEVNLWAPQVPYALNVTQRHYAPLLCLALNSELLVLSTVLLKHSADPELGAVHGCPPIFKPSEYATPLECAISMNSAAASTSFHLEPALESSLKMTHLLIDCGVDVNRFSRDKPPLIFAVGRPRVIEALLGAGADPFKAGKEGGTPLEAADGLVEPESAEILRRAMAHHDGLDEH